MEARGLRGRGGKIMYFIGDLIVIAIAIVIVTVIHMKFLPVLWVWGGDGGDVL